MKIKKATLQLNHISIRPSQVHKLRGFVGNFFKKYDLIHNHDPITGKNLYRYPLIQFKLINKIPTIIAITDKAIEIFSEIFMKLNKIDIDGLDIPIYEKDLKVEIDKFGYSNETFTYEFVSPWIALNQENYFKYKNEKLKVHKNMVLNKALTGNILSMSKYLDYWLEKDHRLKIDLQVKSIKVRLKGEDMIGFTGLFKANFLIPENFGIGKSVSRGFGTVRLLNDKQD